MRIIKVASVKEIQDLDQRTIVDLGIPSLVLMERAALGVLEVIKKIYPDYLNSNKPFSIITGSGNNGGDGIALARLLKAMEKPVKLFFVGNEEKRSNDNKHQLNIVEQLGIISKKIEDVSIFHDELLESDIIIDSLFGVGLTREVTGIYYEVIKIINESSKPVISIDIPSGIDGDTGKILGIAIKASCTVTCGLPKYGHLMDCAADNIGELWCVDIGIPSEYTSSLKGNVITPELIESLFSITRLKNTHKGTYGKLLILAGSINFSGAAVMTAKAALRDLLISVSSTHPKVSLNFLLSP